MKFVENHHVNIIKKSMVYKIILFVFAICCIIGIVIDTLTSKFEFWWFHLLIYICLYTIIFGILIFLTTKIN